MSGLEWLSDLEWGDPPPAAPHGLTGKGPNQAFVAALKARPGEWAKYPIQATRSYARNLRWRFPGTEWAVRPNESGKGDLYGRWIGDV